MEEKEVLETSNETEKVETQATEEIEESGIDLTDTPAEPEENTEGQVNEELPPVKQEVVFTKEQQAKVDEIVSRRVNAAKRNSERELNKRDNLIEKLKVGMGKDSLEDLDKELTDFYSKQGIEMPKPKANERDEEILAKADVSELEELGHEEMERVANEITKKPQDKRTIREKTILAELVTKLTFAKAKSELEKSGADTKILDTQEFKNFQSKFSAATPVSEVYELYNKISKPVVTPAATPKPIGSVKSNVANNEIKDFYTLEEMKNFTEKDYMNNPKLMEAVENSLTKLNK